MRFYFSKIKQDLIIYGPDYKDDLKIAQLRQHAEMEKKEELKKISERIELERFDRIIE